MFTMPDTKSGIVLDLKPQVYEIVIELLLWTVLTNFFC